MTVVEFLDAVEEPLKDEHIPQALGKTIYASLLGTAADLSASENVKVRVYLVTYYIICLLESGFKRLIFFSFYPGLPILYCFSSWLNYWWAHCISKAAYIFLLFLMGE